MKTTKTKNYVTELPQGYTEILHIDATNKKFGVTFNVIALLVLVAVLAVVLPTADYTAFAPLTENLGLLLLFYVAVLSSLVSYIVLHELVHGVAYKALTGQKLTFGLKWSCAFCGVPDIYVYRKTALFALLAPFVVFTAIFLPCTVVLGCMRSVWYVPLGVLLGLHWGGCSGDLYMTGLLLFRYKDARLLVRDTGPQQFLYEESLSTQEKTESN